MNEAAQLAEFVTRRKADKEKVRLSDKFWNTDDVWGKEYKKAIIAAHSILKVYSYTIVMAALKHPKGTWINSLRCRQLHDLARMELSRQNQLNEHITQSEAPTIANPETLPPVRKTNNMMDKLK